MDYLKIRNWQKWQSYRADRGQPPWIKIHRRVMRNPEWVSLSDAEKGRLVCIWLLGADKDGLVPADPEIIKKICYLDDIPDLSTLRRLQFITENGPSHETEDNDNLESPGKIYFIEYDGSIKIGFSKNPWARLNALKTAMPNDPKLLGHFDGTKEKEQELHRLFEGERINREWYRPHPLLVEMTTCGLPDALPASLCGLPDQPEAKAEAEKRREEKKLLLSETINRHGPAGVEKSQETFCSIPLKGKKQTEHHVTEADITEMEECYPGLDVRQCVRECRAWNIANPTQGKTPEGIRRHINTWLKKANNRGEHITKGDPYNVAPEFR